MKFVKLPVVLSLCLVASTGLAQADRAGQPPADNARTQTLAADAGAQKGKKVCKTSVVTGSRFKQRICYTQAEWDEIDLAHQDKMRDIDRQPVGHRDP